MSLLPYLDSNKKIVDGSYIKALGFCKKNFQKERCKSFYESLLLNADNGFHKCPYGLSVYLKIINDEKRIFVSFREHDSYTKKNQRFLNEKVYNPVLLKEQIEALINASISNDISNKKLLDTQSSVDSMIHEVRKLNAQIKEHCDSLFFNYGDKTDLYTLTQDDYTKLFDKLKTLYIISTMINSRYSLYSYEKNPDILTLGDPINTNIYKKFDKCCKVLKNYQKRNVYISFSGSSYKGIKTYPYFEIIPFLLLENAIKYSLNDSKVEVFFESKASSLKIKIKSYSPHCSKEELAKITEKGFRGKNADRTNDGSGIGLYLVKILCDLYDITISFNSGTDDIKNIDGVDYSTFTVSLEFYNVFDMED